MKTVLRFAALITATLAVFATACALGAPAKSPKRKGVTPFALLDAAALQTNDAGITVDEAGLAALPLEAGAPAILGQPAFSYCNFTSYGIDPASGALTARMMCGSQPRTAQGVVPPTVLAQLYTSAVAAAADGGIQ